MKKVIIALLFLGLFTAPVHAQVAMSAQQKADIIKSLTAQLNLLLAQLATLQAKNATSVAQVATPSSDEHTPTYTGKDGQLYNEVTGQLIPVSQPVSDGLNHAGRIELIKMELTDLDALDTRISHYTNVGPSRDTSFASVVLNRAKLNGNKLFQPYFIGPGNAITLENKALMHQAVAVYKEELKKELATL